MKYKYLTLILFLFSTLHARAQLTDTVAHFNLQEAIEYAQRNQSAIQNAKIDEEIAANTVSRPSELVCLR